LNGAISAYFKAMAAACGSLVTTAMQIFRLLKAAPMANAPNSVMSSLDNVGNVASEKSLIEYIN
jgi:hypothetical protein